MAQNCLLESIIILNIKDESFWVKFSDQNKTNVENKSVGFQMISIWLFSSGILSFRLQMSYLTLKN